MKWIKPYKQLPESQDYAEMVFSLSEMLEAFQAGHDQGQWPNKLTKKEYFVKKFNINIDDLK